MASSATLVVRWNWAADAKRLRIVKMGSGGILAERASKVDRMGRPRWEDAEDFKVEEVHQLVKHLRALRNEFLRYLLKELGVKGAVVGTDLEGAIISKLREIEGLEGIQNMGYPAGLP